MLTELCDGARLQVHGLVFRLLAVATTVQTANEYMEAHEHAALLYLDPRGVAYIADKRDKGVKP